MAATGAAGRQCRRAEQPQTLVCRSPECRSPEASASEPSRPAAPCSATGSSKRALHRTAGLVRLQVPPGPRGRLAEGSAIGPRKPSTPGSRHPPVSGASLPHDRGVASRPLSRITPPDFQPCAGLSSSRSSSRPLPSRWAWSQYAFGLFIVPIEETFGWTRTEISASLSFAAVGGLSAPLLGRAMDRFGARPILVLSLVVFGLSFCLRPLMTELWHWYALSFHAVRHLLGLTVLPHGPTGGGLFPHVPGSNDGDRGDGQQRRRSRHAGVHRRPPGRDAVGARHGVVIGIASFAVAGAAVLVIREAPPGRPRTGTWPRCGRQARRPIRTGAPRSESPRDGTHPCVLRGARRDHPGDVHLQRHSPARARASGEQGDGERLRPVRARHPGDRRICGKLLFGWMSERFGARRMMMSNLIGQAAFAALLACAGHTGCWRSAAPLFGLFMGGFGALYILVVQESFGLRHYGSVMGLVNLGTVVSFGLGPLIAGASYDVTGSYGAAFLHRMRPVRRRRRLAHLRAPSHPGDGYGAAAAVTGRDLRDTLSRRRRRTSSPGRHCAEPACASARRAGTG